MIDQNTILEIAREASIDFDRYVHLYVATPTDLEHFATLLHKRWMEVSDGWISVDDRLPDSDTLVLAVCKTEYGQCRVIRAFYADKYSVEQTDGDSDWFEYDPLDETESTPYLPKGWYEANSYEETHWFVNGEISHWMPLPNPPQVKEE